MNNETNYNFLIKSEDKIFKEFQEFVAHSNVVHKELWKILFKKNKELADFEKIASLEEESNFLQRNMLDDLIWAISKNQPRANHLRYMIALIYSTKDIERLIDTAFEIFRTTNYTKDYDFIDFKPLVKVYLELLTRLKTYIGAHYKDNLEKIKEEKKKFEEKFYDYVNEISHNLKHKGYSSKVIYQCNSICKNISLSINYYFNAFFNFKYIKSISAKTKKIDLKKIKK